MYKADGSTMLTKITPYVMAALIACASVPAMAINAEPKKEAQPAPAQPTEPTKPPVKESERAPETKPAQWSAPPKQDLLDRLKQQVEKSGDTKAGQYDNYIDKNSDGVDDRVKCKSQQKETRPQPAAEPTVKATQAKPAKQDPPEKSEPEKKSPDRKRPRR
jgi:hypothetical protein